MSYPETIEYLYRLTPAFEQIGAAAYKPGLDNMLRLMEALGNPHRQLRTIHVAGTNGKGSTCHMLAAILQSQGYRTGLYTSPHLIDFGERIRVNGQMISRDYVVRFVSEHDGLIRLIQPSFFELATAMAFCWFHDCGSDICVIETGLGGRLDSTNIITPMLSVITNIGLDHTAQLGNTVEQIAREKAGIIKHGIPVVIGEADEHTMPVFSSVAADRSAPLFVATKHEADNIVPQLTGFCQTKNINTVLTAVDVLHNAGLAIDASAVKRGLEHVCELTGLRGRWETLCTQPLVICDTGHNAHGIRDVARQLAAMPQNKHIIFGMVADKDFADCLSLLPRDAVYYFTQPDSKRALPAMQLAAAAGEAGLRGSVCPHLSDAIDAALRTAKNDDMIFIGGSNYLVGQALQTQPFCP